MLYQPMHCRLAHLGFLVQGENGEGSKGNFGFWDQVRALRWVQNNIGKFGGNPNKVAFLHSLALIDYLMELIELIQIFLNSRESDCFCLGMDRIPTLPVDV